MPAPPPLLLIRPRSTHTGRWNETYSPRRCGLRDDRGVLRRLRGAAPWGVEIPPLPGTIVFHLVIEGELVLDVAGEIDDG